MAQYYLETHRQQQYQEKFVALVSNAVDALVPLLNKEVSCSVFCTQTSSTVEFLVRKHPKCQVSVVTYGTYASERQNTGTLNVES